VLFLGDFGCWWRRCVIERCHKPRRHAPWRRAVLQRRRGLWRRVIWVHFWYSFPQGPTPCSLGLSATSQQYFSLRTNQPPATSQNQPAVLFSQNKPAPAISHQPTEQAANVELLFERDQNAKIILPYMQRSKMHRHEIRWVLGVGREMRASRRTKR
jgi:hypothetical protein